MQVLLRHLDLEVPYNFCHLGMGRKIIGYGARQSRHAESDRRSISGTLHRDSWSPLPFPWLYGDAMNIPPAMSPRQHAALTDTQMRFLQQWAAGEFIPDYDPEYAPPVRSTRSHPGSSLICSPGLPWNSAWPMHFIPAAKCPGRCVRRACTWRRSVSSMPLPNTIEPNYGSQLTSTITSSPNGPLNRGQAPGSITRWMALPWQTDAASCRSGYDRAYDPYLPTFWPARVPNQVLSEADYDIVMDAEQRIGTAPAGFCQSRQLVRSPGFGPELGIN